MQPPGCLHSCAPNRGPAARWPGVTLPPSPGLPGAVNRGGPQQVPGQGDSNTPSLRAMAKAAAGGHGLGALLLSPVSTKAHTLHPLPAAAGAPCRGGSPGYCSPTKKSQRSASGSALSGSHRFLSFSAAGAAAVPPCTAAAEHATERNCACEQAGAMRCIWQLRAQGLPLMNQSADRH